MVVDDSHVWNMVKLDNKYYYVDTNMDDRNSFSYTSKGINIGEKIKVRRRKITDK